LARSNGGAETNGGERFDGRRIATLAGPLRRPAVELPARLLRSFPFVFGPFVSVVFDRFLRILRDLGSLDRSENAFKAGFITGADTQVGPYDTIRLRLYLPSIGSVVSIGSFFNGPTDWRPL